MRWFLCSRTGQTDLCPPRKCKEAGTRIDALPHLRRSKQGEKPCFQSVISSLLLSSHIAVGLQKEPSGPAPGDSTAAIDSVGGFQSSPGRSRPLSSYRPTKTPTSTLLMAASIPAVVRKTCHQEGCKPTLSMGRLLSSSAARRK